MTNQLTVVVTGGAGYVGSRLVPKLLFDGHRVRVLDTMFFGNGLHEHTEHPRLEIVEGDIRDPTVMEDTLRGTDVVVHLAAVANDPSFDLDPLLGRSINIDCLPRVMTEAKSAGCRRFIYASSASVYGVSSEPVVDESSPCVPITDYNRYKAWGERILFDLADSSFETVAVRAATVCGWSPRQRLDLTVNILTATALARGEISVFGGSQYRPNVHIGDLTRFYADLVGRDDLSSVDGQPVNVGLEDRTVADLATQIKGIVEDYFGTAVPIVTATSDDVRSYRLDSTRAQNELEFRFVHSIRDAVIELCERWASGWFAGSANILTDPRYHNIRNIQAGDWSLTEVAR